MTSLTPRSVQVVAVLVIAVACMATDQAPTSWRYDLHPGDHLIYRYTFQRRIQEDEELSQVDARFQTHVLVVGENEGRIALGFQRNREFAELTEYRSKGKDKLTHEQIDFKKRMQARPSHFSEAMEISPTGEPQYSWEVARETSSHLLGAFHEVMNLPPIPLAKGGTWHGSTLLGFDLKWVDDESIHGKLCHHIEGTSSDRSIKLSYWWSPESGVLEQIALDGTYPSFGGTTHETARMELESRVRGEQFANWLGSTETSQGALQAILLTPSTPISAEQLSLVLTSEVLTSEDPASQALALAIASRRKMEVPPRVLDTLRQSKSARVRAIIDASSTSGNSHEPADECHRALPVKAQAVKFGTTFELAPASKDIPEIPYLLRVPLTYHADRPAPLLIYLSGGAGMAIDGVNNAEDVVSQTDYIVIYPQALRYWWTPDTARRVDTVLYDVLQRYNIDRDRIYLTGFSNGGTGAIYFATLWPQRFAAVVSLMGAGQCMNEIKAGLPNLENLPLLFVHGENDPVITPDCSTTTHAALTDLHPPVKPELKILPNRGHDITIQSDDGLALAFFKNKLRNPFPHEVNVSLSDQLAARGYWIEILDGKPGKSGMEARVKTDNTIDIHSHDVKSIRLHLRPQLLPKPGDIRIVWNGKKMFSGPLRDYCSLVPVSTGDPKLDLADTRDLVLP